MMSTMRGELPSSPPRKQAQLKTGLPEALQDTFGPVVSKLKFFRITSEVIFQGMHWEFNDAPPLRLARTQTSLNELRELFSFQL